MGDTRKYTPEEKAAFVHGYTYAKAEEMKKNGEFKDMTINEVAVLILKEVTSQW